MYNAYVTRLKNVRPHSNANRMLLADCFGNTICVGLGAKNGDIGVYFPTDGQLSVEYAEKNNLVRKKDENRKNIGGYLEPDKRNITAIKLRGEKSDGLFMPLESLGYTGVDISTLTEGTVINVVNGHEICCKYIPRQKTSSNNSGGKVNKTRKKKVAVAPLFAEHADTEQLAYNLNAFKKGDLVEITLKMHGCFIKGTKVRMADGKLKAIEKIKIGDSVLGYDIEKGKIIPTKVVNTFKNLPSENWNELKFSRNGILGDKRGTQISTYNHKYWVEEKHSWVPAEELKVGDKVSTLIPSPVLTQLQKSIAIGQFLGDGCLLSFREQTAEIQESKKKEHKKYLEYISKLTSGWFYLNGEKVSGYGTNIITGRTVRSADLFNYMSKYSTFNNKDSLPRLKEAIVDIITPLSIAIWYMGDGSLGHSEKQKDRALLAICRYKNKTDRDIIKKIFGKFDIEPTFYLDANNYWRIRFNTSEAYKLFDLISPYIPNCMRYKLPKDYPNNFIEITDKEEYNSKGYVLSPQTVLENNKIIKMQDEYDLETELHNYVVGLTIVHNTSGRTGYLPKIAGYKRTLLDRLFRREGTPIYDWGYVTGTRRVVLEDYDGGFYGDNSFREPHAAFFEGKLQKGETVYYEIVGFTNTGAPIMGTVDNKKTQDKEFIKKYGKTTTFSYGCAPSDEEKPQSACYVYRMTMTNEDGYVVEYSPDYMRYRCEQMGAKYVPVLWRGIIPPVNSDGLIQSDDFVADENGQFKEWIFKTPGEYIKDIAEQYYDGADPIGLTHVREGVVVRIVNRPKFAAFKHKNWNFKFLEGIAKANADAPDMEEIQEIENS